MDKKPTYEELEQISMRLEREIERRKEAEKALQESEEMYRDLFENAPNAYFSISVEDGSILRCNTAAMKLLGYDKATLMGMKIFDLYPDTSYGISKAQNVFKRFKEGESIRDVELQMKHKNGYPIWISLSVEPVRVNGNIVESRSVVIDISERKHAEDALLESGERMRAIFEAADSVSFIMMDLAGTENRILEFSPGAERMFGYSCDEILGKPVAMLRLPEDVTRIPKVIETMGQRKAGFTGESTLVRKSGERFPALFTTRPILDAEGNTTAALSVSIDISEQVRIKKELEKQTSKLSERVKDLNCLYGISGFVEKPNITLEEILQGVVDLIPPSWQYPEITCSRIILADQEFRTKNFTDSPWKQDSEIIVNGRSIGRLEVFYLEQKPEKDEGPFLTEERLLINAIAERLGKIIERIETRNALLKSHANLEMRVKERTAELVMANEKLNQEIKERKRAEKKLKENSEKIRLFAYSVSHDLKSPVFSVYGLTKLLNKKYGDILDERGKNYCEQILKASEQIAKLAEQINVYISTKGTPVSIETVKIKQILQMVREEFSSQISIRQIKWQEPESIPEINADSLSITRVIRNLIDNALKYGGDDLSEIKIGYVVSDEYHILSVSDDGVGMNVEDPNMIFELFTRHETSRGVEGAGLGLAIVKEIAEQHGGKVWVESGVEKGSIFNMSISRHL